MNTDSKTSPPAGLFHLYLEGKSKVEIIRVINHQRERLGIKPLEGKTALQWLKKRLVLMAVELLKTPSPSSGPTPAPATSQAGFEEFLRQIVTTRNSDGTYALGFVQTMWEAFDKTYARAGGAAQEA